MSSKAKSITASEIAALPPELEPVWTKIKNLQWSDFLVYERDRKLAKGTRAFLRKKRKLAKSDSKPLYELLSPRQFDAIARDVLTPAELSTMHFDDNGLVSIMTPRGFVRPGLFR